MAWILNFQADLFVLLESDPVTRGEHASGEAAEGQNQEDENNEYRIRKGFG